MEIKSVNLKLLKRGSLINLFV